MLSAKLACSESALAGLHGAGAGNADRYCTRRPAALALSDGPRIDGPPRWLWLPRPLARGMHPSTRSAVPNGAVRVLVAFTEAFDSAYCPCSGTSHSFILIPTSRDRANAIRPPAPPPPLAAMPQAISAAHEKPKRLFRRVCVPRLGLVPLHVQVVHLRLPGAVVHLPHDATCNKRGSCRLVLGRGGHEPMRAANRRRTAKTS